MRTQERGRPAGAARDVNGAAAARRDATDPGPLGEWSGRGGGRNDGSLLLHGPADLASRPLEGCRRRGRAWRGRRPRGARRGRRLTRCLCRGRRRPGFSAVSRGERTGRRNVQTAARGGWWCRAGRRGLAGHAFGAEGLGARDAVGVEDERDAPAGDELGSRPNRSLNAKAADAARFGGRRDDPSSLWRPAYAPALGRGRPHVVLGSCGLRRARPGAGIRGAEGEPDVSRLPWPRPVVRLTAAERTAPIAHRARTPGVEELTVLTSWAEAVAEASYSPSGDAEAALADAAADAPWRGARGLAEPSERLNGAIEAVRSFDPTSGDRPADGLLCAVRDGDRHPRDVVGRRC